MKYALFAFALLCGSSAFAQSSSASVGITIVIPEVLQVVSNRVAATPTGADQQVVVRSNLRTGYCVRAVVAGVVKEPRCTTAIGDFTFTYRHEFNPQLAPTIGVEVAPS